MRSATATDNDVSERFSILEQLGKSADVTTFKAVDHRHNRLVVIKILAHDHYQTPEVRRHIRRQTKLLAQLKHPYLLPILLAQDTGEAFYWVMPYLTNGNLKQRLDSAKLTLSESGFIMRRLREVLIFLHDNEIQHLNIGPQNVLFDDGGTLQLADANTLPLAIRFKKRSIPNEQQRRAYDLSLLDQLEQCLNQSVMVNRLPPAPVVANGEKGTEKRQQLAMLSAVLSAVSMLLFLLMQFAPLIGARVATPLRRVLGNEYVAFMETALFQMQDRSAQIRYDLGLAEPERPWEPLPLPTPPSTVTPTLLPTLEQTIEVEVVDRVAVSAEIIPSFVTLQDVEPFGELTSEGVWQPYLFDSDANAVANRTFLQPDAERPLTVVGIVAFDLTEVGLNYVLGSQEPSRVNGPRGTGIIPTQDRVGGRVVATFNGGFMSTHGGFGAMADGVVALEPRGQLATIAIDQSNQVQIGAWDDTVSPTEEWQSYRQNARLIIKDGSINPDVYNNSIVDWGGTINSEIVTWRSAIALNDERNILYYVAGAGLSMPALADTLVRLKAENGMLLDINAYWVHFASVRADGERLTAEALFADEMSLHVDRYLKPSERDFFYVVAKK